MGNRGTKKLREGQGSPPGDGTPFTISTVTVDEVWKQFNLDEARTITPEQAKNILKLLLEKEKITVDNDTLEEVVQTRLLSTPNANDKPGRVSLDSLKLLLAEYASEKSIDMTASMQEYRSSYANDSGSSSTINDDDDVPKEAPEELKKKVSEKFEKEGKTLDEIHVSHLPCMKKDYLLFHASEPHMKMTFAHDRGMINNTLSILGAYRISAGTILEEDSEWGAMFRKFDLTFEEALQFWQRAFGQYDYVKEGSWGPHSKSQAPTWEDNVLWLSVYKYTGMRGGVFDHYRVEFPKVEGGRFRKTLGSMNPKSIEAEKKKAEEKAQKEKEEAEALKRKEEELAKSGKWADVPDGLTPFLNEERTHMVFVEWSGSSGRINVFPSNNPMPQTQLERGPVSPMLRDYWNERWNGVPLASAMDELKFNLQMTPLPNWQDHNLSVDTEYKPEEFGGRYQVVVKYKGNPVDLKNRWETDTKGGERNEEAVRGLTKVARESVRFFVDPESGIVAVCETEQIGGNFKGIYGFVAVSGDPRAYFKVDKEEFVKVAPSKMIIWKEK